MGPLLFLIYVNDMRAAVNCKLLLYADDSALIVSGKNVSEIESSLEKELESLDRWLIDNKLSLHLGKTESILFGTKRKIKECKSMNISCNGRVIETKSEITYLGLILDQSLTGKSIVSRIVSKCSGRLAFLYRKSEMLDLESKRLLIFAFTQCHF